MTTAGAVAVKPPAAYYQFVSRRLSPRLALALALASVGGCAARGREVFVREGCGSCHRFRGAGNGSVVDLSDVASRKSASQLRAQITGAGRENPASRMPEFDHLSWFDLESLIAYLRS